MKSLIAYLKRTQAKEIVKATTNEEWLDNVKTMYEWYITHVGQNYSHKRKNTYCDLIGKEVKADCSGFVGACLYLSGFTDDPINWNVKFGSFNNDGRPNNDDDSSNCDVENLRYMKDIPEWDSHNFRKKDAIAGDIIYSSFHVTIAANDGATELYDWGRQIKDTGNKSEPIEYYEHEYKYRGYWRLISEVEEK